MIVQAIINVFEKYDSLGNGYWVDPIERLCDHKMVQPIATI